MPGRVIAGHGRWVHAARGVRLCVFRAVGMRGVVVYDRRRVRHGRTRGSCHLAHEHDEDNQATMSQPNHSRSVPLRCGSGLSARQSHVRGSAMDLTCVPCTSEMTATGRPLLSLGVTLTA